MRASASFATSCLCLRRARAAVVLLLCLAGGGAGAAPAPVHQDLRVTVDTPGAPLGVRATVTLPAAPATGTVDLFLAAAETPRPGEPETRLAPLGGEGGGYRVTLPAGARSFTLDYAVDWPAARASAEYLYLDGGNAWYPQVAGHAFVSFALDLALPTGWVGVSQGGAWAPGPGRQGWREDQPQKDIYLVAAPFSTYHRATPHGEAQVYLLGPDPDLAETYLAATARYLHLYSRLIGPYPYAKFALVENVAQTGYGMASFTLLGSRVIRLPFIVHTSYPHEVLHNWWGNGVFIDYARGNWSEGLTTYLADYLLAEGAGRGAGQRRGALQKYAAYVSAERDFPLRAFRARHGEPSQAVGYSKGMMFYHMLRQRLGDARFLEGLRRLWGERRFQVATFEDLRAAFEAASGEDLEGFFRQWVDRPGAPALAVTGVAATATSAGWRLTGELHQTQGGAPYALEVPLALTLEGHPEAWTARVPLRDTRAPFALTLPARPLRLDVDPAFDLFRRLAPGEVPPTLGLLFGSEAPLFVVPGDAPPPLAAAYRALARGWGGDEAEVVSDRDLPELPADRAAWVLGWSNRLLPRVAALAAAAGARLDGDRLEHDDTVYPRTEHAVALAVRARPDRPAVGLVAAGNPALVATLARKLTHYNRYGVLAFATDDARNTLKDEWPARGDSPLTVALVPGAPAPRGSLPEPAALDAYLAGDEAP